VIRPHPDRKEAAGCRGSSTSISSWGPGAAGTGRLVLPERQGPEANLIGRAQPGGAHLQHDDVPGAAHLGRRLPRDGPGPHSSRRRYSERRKAFGQKIRNYEGVSFKVGRRDHRPRRCPGAHHRRWEECRCGSARQPAARQRGKESSPRTRPGPSCNLAMQNRRWDRLHQRPSRSRRCSATTRLIQIWTGNQRDHEPPHSARVLPRTPR